MKVANRWIETLPEDLRQLVTDWAAVQPLRTENENRLWQRLRIEWNYNSNHKEGFWRVAQTPDGGQTRKWIEPGRYKTQPNPVLTTIGEIFHFASPEETPARMADLIQWLRVEMETPSLVLSRLLARLHHEFVHIHPFDDGNGRVVRLLLNYVLLRAGLLPVVVKSRDRRRYLELIAVADTGDLSPLAEYFNHALRWSLQLGLAASSRLIELETEAE